MRNAIFPGEIAHATHSCKHGAGFYHSQNIGLFLQKGKNNPLRKAAHASCPVTDIFLRLFYSERQKALPSIVSATCSFSARHSCSVWSLVTEKPASVPMTAQS